MFAHVIVSVLAGYGMAVALVEKKRQWPVRRYHILIKKLLGKIHRRLPKMLSCTVCTSFWTTLIADATLGIAGLIHHHTIIFTWPLSGFIAVGLTWTVMDILISLGGMASPKQ